MLQPEQMKALRDAQGTVDEFYLLILSGFSS